MLSSPGRTVRAPAGISACPCVKGGRHVRHHHSNSASLLRSFSNAHAQNSGNTTAPFGGAAPAWAAKPTWLQPRTWLQRVDRDRLTRHLLAWSVVPAVLLALLAVGQASLAWQASLREMFSFTVLLGVFISCEPAAAAASAVSAAGAALSLVVYPAGQLPAHAATTALLLAAAYAATLCTALWPQHLWAQPAVSGTTQQPSTHTASQSGQQGAATLYQQHSNDTEGQLQAIQQGLGVLGGGLLLQLCWETIARRPQAAPWAAAVAVGAATVMAGNLWLDTRVKHNPQLLEFKSDWPAWSATLLLILPALDQLVQLALHPGPAPDVSGFVLLLLLVLANGLMVPRALHTRQFMWFTGTCSGTLLAAGQLVLLGLQSVSQAALSGPHVVSGVLPWLQQVWCIPWRGSLLGCLSSWLGGASAMVVGALLVWLWLAASVLLMGWRWILSENQT